MSAPWFDFSYSFFYLFVYLFIHLSFALISSCKSLHNLPGRKRSPQSTLNNHEKILTHKKTEKNVNEKLEQ